MIYSLPKTDKPAINFTHFPTKHQAFIFRAYEYVPAEKIVNCNYVIEYFSEKQ